LDTADLIEANDKYHVQEVVGSVETTRKVTDLVKLRGYPAKRDWSREPFESFYSVVATEELRTFHSKNLKVPRDPVFKLPKQFFSTWASYFGMPGQDVGVEDYISQIDMV
jgi:hypothetical protein